MSETLLKHSRLPKKYEPQGQLTDVKREITVIAEGLAGTDPKDILRRYLSDESTLDIASSYKVTRQALGQYLLRHAEEDWKECQVARAIARKEAAEDSLENAKDPLELAKARELLKSAQWDLERVCRRIYGQEVNINMTVLDLGDRLRRARERVLNPIPEISEAA